MTEMVTSGSMSGEGKRSDGLLGESDPERCCSHSAPPALHATALLFDSTSSASCADNGRSSLGTGLAKALVSRPFTCHVAGLVSHLVFYSPESLQLRKRSGRRHVRCFWKNAAVLHQASHAAMRL
jgi:hypothetical protein